MTQCVLRYAELRLMSTIMIHVSDRSLTVATAMGHKVECDRG